MAELDGTGSEKNNTRKGWLGRTWRRHPFAMSLALSAILGVLGYSLLGVLLNGNKANTMDGNLFVFVGALIGIFLVYPFVLTGMEILLALGDCERWAAGREERYRRGRIFDVVAIPLGVYYNVLLLSFIEEVMFGADWDQVLHNAQVHTPVETQSMPTVLILALVGYLGYLTVNFFVKPGKTPPLIPVLGMAAMYLGTAVSILWGIQVCKPGSPVNQIYLSLLPLNCVIITARTIRYKVREWKQLIGTEPQGGACGMACSILRRSECWPFAAFLLMWPLLGILIGVMILFGQRPDAMIRAFTETADWNLSRRVAPQNVMYDEHYLCTVAAGGHKKVVKPLRLGVRHGHQVIVNRQLCVANAFEQILEERTPRFHRAVRHFYDTYGFPIARLIRSRYLADLVYFLMKPVEWCFLVVLYLTDIDPESRIALQYTGKHLSDFGK